MSGRLGMPILLCLVVLALAVSPLAASAQDATLDAVLSYVGPGPGGFDVYRYDYTLTKRIQPAWAAPMIRAFASAKRTGVQSAASSPSAMSGRVVTIASAFGAFSCDQGSTTRITSALWT